MQLMSWTRDLNVFSSKTVLPEKFCGPGFVAKSRFESEPGITPFNIYCFSLALRVLHQLGQKQMKKWLISRAWFCLDLQRCLSQLPKVSVRERTLRSYGSPSLTILPYSSPPVSGNSPSLDCSVL